MLIASFIERDYTSKMKIHSHCGKGSKRSRKVRGLAYPLLLVLRTTAFGIARTSRVCRVVYRAARSGDGDSVPGWLATNRAGCAARSAVLLGPEWNHVRDRIGYNRLRRDRVRIPVRHACRQRLLHRCGGRLAPCIHGPGQFLELIRKGKVKNIGCAGGPLWTGRCPHESSGFELPVAPLECSGHVVA